MFIVCKLSYFGYYGWGIGESFEYTENVSTLLHRYDSELVFLVDPHQELFRLIVENASAFGPVSIQATRLKESVTFFE